MTARLASIALALCVTGGLAGCKEKPSGDLPPAGLAGDKKAQPSGQGQPPASAGRGAGVNPGGSPHGAASQPAAAAQQASQAASQPAGNAPPAGQPAGPGAASQPGGSNPQVIKGGGQQAVPPPAPEKATVVGTITETMNAAGYTYLKVKADDGNELWAAVGETKAEVGQQVTIDESITMSNFHSKTLNRTFPSIMFGTLR